MLKKTVTTVWSEQGKSGMVQIYMVAPTDRLAKESTLVREFGVKFFENTPKELVKTSKKAFFKNINDAQAFQLQRTGSGLYELNLPFQAVTTAKDNPDQFEVDASQITSLSIVSVSVIAIPTYVKYKIENPLLTGADTPHVEVGSPPNSEVLKRICSNNK